MASMVCPDDSELLAILFNETADTRTHVEDCPPCRQRLARLRSEVVGLRRAAEEAASREGAETPQATKDSRATVMRPNAPPVPREQVPSRIGKYLVVGLLGEGGQASVYRAVNPNLNKELVLKVSRRTVLPERTERDRLIQEARLLADLDHPNLARVYDADFWEDRPFVVMEYVRGRTLAESLRQQPAAPRQAAALTAQLARALAAAHRAGVLHLDLKPSNIMIDEAGRPRILDFGLARVCPPSLGDMPADSSGGTPEYMAPEQARGDQEAIGPASDLFALGGVLYRMLAGRPPFRGETAQQTLQRARQCDFDRSALRRARVPRALERICLKALTADPSERYARAEDMAADLERFVNRPRRIKRIAGAGLALVGLLLVAGYFYFVGPPVEFPTGHHPVIAFVQRGQDTYDFSAALPLRGTDDFRIDCLLPRNFQPRVFSRDLNGKWEEYSQFTIKWDGRFDRLQADVHWTGKGTGTRVILVCAAGSSQSLAGEEIRKIVQVDASPWETLPPKVLVRMNRDGVQIGSQSRGMEPGREGAVGRIEDRLEHLRLRLRDRCEYFVAVAYPHADE